MSDSHSDPIAEAAAATGDLVKLIERLRAECPWDERQTFQDLAGYLLEECYETLDALAREDLGDLEGELGDLLLQIVFLAQLGREKRAFDLGSVARRIHTKLVSRHPHVFGEAEVKDAAEVRAQWERIKKEERAGKGEANASPFEGLPSTLPALLKASRMSSRAADLGFEWAREEDVLAKLDEEVAEFRAEVLAESPSPRRIADELGDILFTIVNVARRHHVDPEAALQSTNVKFRRRFEAVAARLAAQGRELAGTPLEELDRLWDEVKAEEKADEKADEKAEKKEGPA
ncbi:MAG: nucleoside triphosphate pyrophosphohydrolase [Thermoanaerobaculia bacterium]